ncbi:MAG: hypothetical protein NWR72_11570 [Bacteroidia bacterium]|nr:hypothetical protein [Bacteroidia bacterium]
MQTRLFLLLCALTFLITPVAAEQVLGGHDFSSGKWALVGVPVHNYQMLPIQQDLGTFVTEDLSLLHTLQKRWDFDMTFDDKCDYHYALKLYHDGELIETLDLNLYCGYITRDGFSYSFPVGEFDLLRDRAKSIPWSRIRFQDPETLKRAIVTLDNTKDVYWYEDVQKFLFPGYFMITLDNLHWNTDRDSLHEVVSQYLFDLSQNDGFYLEEYYYLITDGAMTVKYIVNCSETLATVLNDENSAYFRWRSHFQDHNGMISILAIGVDERRYQVLMEN